MANTYYQCYIHLVFAVKNRECLIREPIREKVQKYICGIVNQDKCKVISIYCNSDHTHILVGFRPSISISDLVRDIKSVSSKFINEQKLMHFHFQWQDGYGAMDEYQRFLEKHEIVYDASYLFDRLD